MSVIRINNTASSSARAMRHTSLGILLLALLCLPWADFSISTRDPWLEIGALAQGLLNPIWPDSLSLAHALANTLAFALQGVALGALAGLVLALGYQRPWVRRLAAFIRAIHELFWALLFIQVWGLSPLAGVLAIAIPYAGTFAKIYGELFEEVDPAPAQALPSGSGRLSALLYTLLPQALKPMLIYTSYRLECGIRSSAVLGFIGLPTLGFYLESLLRQGHYGEAATYLYVLIVLIATMRWWLQAKLVPAYLLAAVIWLPPVAPLDWPLLLRFVSEDIVPSPLRQGDWSGLWPWLNELTHSDILPGLGNTLVLALLALVVTALFTLALFPAISPLFGNRGSRAGGHLLLVTLRSLPEYLLAFVGMLLWGPSMLPAMLALALHNGAIIAHLLGRYSSTLLLREDASTGLNRYAFEVLPRIYRPFLAFTLYRFEILMRETAMLGILGIPTLGFFIDSAFSEFRFDRALALLLVSAGLNMTVDALARHLRQRLHLSSQPESL